MQRMLIVGLLAAAAPAAGQAPVMIIGLNSGPGVGRFRPATAYNSGKTVWASELYMIGYLRKHFFLQTGIGVAGKGQTVRFPSTMGLSAPVRQELTYLPLSLQAGFRFGKNSRFQLSAGPYTAFLLRAREVPSDNQPAYDAYKYFTTDFGLSGTVRLALPLSNRMAFTTAVSGELGLSDISLYENRVQLGTAVPFEPAHVSSAALRLLFGLQWRL